MSVRANTWELNKGSPWAHEVLKDETNPVKSIAFVALAARMFGGVLEQTNVLSVCKTIRKLKKPLISLGRHSTTVHNGKSTLDFLNDDTLKLHAVLQLLQLYHKRSKQLFMLEDILDIPYTMLAQAQSNRRFGFHRLYLKIKQRKEAIAFRAQNRIAREAATLRRNTATAALADDAYPPMNWSQVGPSFDATVLNDPDSTGRQCAEASAYIWVDSDGRRYYSGWNSSIGTIQQTILSQNHRSKVERNRRRGITMAENAWRSQKHIVNAHTLLETRMNWMNGRFGKCRLRPMALLQFGVAEVFDALELECIAGRLPRINSSVRAHQGDTGRAGNRRDIPTIRSLHQDMTLQMRDYQTNEMVHVGMRPLIAFGTGEMRRTIHSDNAVRLPEEPCDYQDHVSHGTIYRPLVGHFVVCVASKYMN
jgi:hypothetical protein